MFSLSSIDNLRRSWLILIALVVSGCASHLEYDAVSAPASDLPRFVELADAPFFAQELHHCGPASLAMLLNAADVQVAPEELANLTYLPGRAGSLGVELLATPRQYRLLGYQVTPRLHALLAEVAAGRPVLVLQNLGLSWLPRWHYALLIGFDLDRQEVILRSGTTERLTMPLRTFEHTWRRGERWAMLALTPGDLPAVAQEVDYLKAALGLEAVGYKDMAGAAYRRAIEQWPGSVSSWMAWGNNRYSSDDLVTAEQAFRQALTLDGDFAPAYNNLAQVMLDRGQLEAAEHLINQALQRAENGPATQHLPTFRQTLRDIQQQQRRQPASDDARAAL